MTSALTVFFKIKKKMGFFPHLRNSFIMPKVSFKTRIKLMTDDLLQRVSNADFLTYAGIKKLLIRQTRREAPEIILY